MGGGGGMGNVQQYTVAKVAYIHTCKATTLHLYACAPPSVFLLLLSNDIFCGEYRCITRYSTPDCRLSGCCVNVHP